MTDVVDPKLCPLCGHPNGCNLASSTPHQGPCWCTSQKVPGDLLLRVPEAARRKACICHACITRRGNSQPISRQ